MVKKNVLNTTARTVQDRCPRLSMSSRPSTVVLVRRLPACLWLPTAPSPVIRFTVVCRSTCTQYVCDRCFATAGPRVWNSLPAELQQCSSLRQLKTFLFRSWDYGTLWLFVNKRCIEIVLLTYIPTKINPTSSISIARTAQYTVQQKTVLIIFSKARMLSVGGEGRGYITNGHRSINVPCAVRKISRWCRENVIPSDGFSCWRQRRPLQ